jgi:phosphohistidine phosphatase SixA
MTLFLVRHASAGSRGSLGAANDHKRALDAVGHEQAAHIVDLLRFRGIKEIYSSSALRCVETVTPLAEELGLNVEVHPALIEGQSADGAVHLARTLAGQGTTAVFSSHGDIIPDMIQTMAREGLMIVGQRAWAKGSTWEIRSRGGDLTEAHFLGPY